MRAPRDRPQIAGVHCRPAHLLHRDLRSRRDCLEHYSLECSLAQLTHEQLQQEALLGWCGECEQLMQLFRAACRRARTASGGECCESPVHHGNRQRRGARRLDRSRTANVGRPDADAPLRHLTREVMHRRRDLLGREPGEECRELAHLPEAAGRRTDALRGLSQGREQRHDHIVGRKPAGAASARNCQRAEG